MVNPYISENRTELQSLCMDVLRSLNDDYYAIFILRHDDNVLEPCFVSEFARPLMQVIGDRPALDVVFGETFPSLVHHRDSNDFRSKISYRQICSELEVSDTVKHVFYMDNGTGEYKYVEFRFCRLEGCDISKVVFGLRNADSEIQKSMEHTRQLEDAVKKFKQAEYDLRRDFLTGLYNRLDLFEMLKDSLTGAARPIYAMYMIDIDNYKLFNDLYGHIAGDECLQTIGDCLKQFSINRDARFYRYGGEEILGICYDAALDAERFARELMEEISALHIPHKGSATGYLTVSIGYTTDNSRYEKMIDKADKAMYKAKKAGKNRALCYENIPISEIFEGETAPLSDAMRAGGGDLYVAPGELSAENIIASYHLNLTQNACSDTISYYPTLSELPSEGTAADFFERAAKLVHPLELNKFRERFSVESLLSAYENGISAFNDEFQFHVYPHHYSCLSFSTDIYLVPFSGDIEMVLNIIDINYRKRMEQVSERLVEMNYEFLCLIDPSSGHMTPFQGTTPAELAQRGKEELFYDAQGLEVGQELMNLNDVLHLDRNASLAAVVRNLETMPVYTIVFPTEAQQDGKRGYKRLRYAYLDDRRELIMMTREDITDLISKEIDDLTGLMNADGFHRNVKEWIERNPGRRYRIIQYDFDGFRNINGIFSYEEGNRLLREMGRHMLTVSSEDSFCGHFSADHFARFSAVDGNPTPEEYYDRFISSHFETLAKYRTTLHAGVYDLCEDDVDSYSMSYRAQLALQSVKGDYKRPIAYYESSMLKQEIQAQSLLADFDKALSEEQFQVYFQPQVDYLRQRFVGAEALVRWAHPTLGMVSPDAFIPALERHGLVSSLDLYVWEKCCSYLRKWLDRYGEDAPLAVSVNISRIDISALPLVQIFKSLIRKYDLTPDRLRLEITESAFISDSYNLVKTVQELQSSGFTVEMDDFGSGYSSLNTLKDIPVNALKLDMKFLSYDVENNTRGANILSSVVRMANWLKLPVIAEGVETKTQAEYLQSIGCYYMQGYYFAKPMPLEQFEALLDENPFAQARRFHDVSLAGMAQFWKSDAQSTLLFNSYIGGAAIVEFNNGSVEIVRANPRFFEQIGTDEKEYTARMLDPISTLDEENRAKFIGMLKEAIATGREAQCETQNCFGPGCNPVWLSATVRMIAHNNERYLFYMQSVNTTREHLAEEMAQRQRKIDMLRSDIIIKQMNAVTFEYYIESHELHFRMCGKDGRVNEHVRILDTEHPEFNYIYPTWFEAVIAMLHDFTRPGSTRQFAQMELISKFWGDRWQWSRGHCACMRGAAGEAYCLVGQIENIQSEKDDEELHALIGRSAQ